MLAPHEIVVSRWSRMEINHRNIFVANQLLLDFELWLVYGFQLASVCEENIVLIKVLHVDCSLFRDVNNSYDTANETEPCVLKCH